MNNTRTTRNCLRHSLALAALLAIPPIASAQTVTNWVAFNDHAAGPNTAPNVTTYNMRGWVLATDSGATTNQPRIGPLTNSVAGAYPAGAQLAATLQTGTRTRRPELFPNATLGDPNAGTPAYDLFIPGGAHIVDMAGAGSSIGLGNFASGAMLGNDAVVLTFTNLDPGMKYAFRGTAIRNGTIYGANHPGRWTYCEIEGAASFTEASTPGCLTSITPLPEYHPLGTNLVFPALNLAPSQAIFQSGMNSEGNMVGWDNINPGADGSFSIVARGWGGVVTNTFLNFAPAPPEEPVTITNAFDRIGYALTAISLTEYGPLTPVSITVQPAASTTVTQLLSLSLSVTTFGSAPQHQWYKNDVAIPGAVTRTFSVASAAPTDSGNYYVVVSNSQNTLTSTVAHVAVVADTFPPVVKRVNGSANFNEITVEFNERVAGGMLDAFNYKLLLGGVEGDGPTTATLLDPGSVNAGTIVMLTFGAPLAENTVYQLKVGGDIADIMTPAPNVIDGNIAYSFRTWVATPASGLLYEAFTGVLDPNTISSLTNSPNYPNNPFTNKIIGVFDSRALFPDDARENYGSRTRGLFIPPTTGKYRFFVRSDDPSQVFLNPNGPSPTGKQLILDETGCCGNWDRFDSEAFQMTAGQGYYIEALQKEGGGGDYVKVAALLDDAGRPLPNDTANASLDPAAITGAAIGYPAAPAGVGGEIGITQQPVNVVTQENQFVTFTVGATNTYGLPMVFEWRRDGIAIPDANRSSYTLAPVPADNGVVFSVVASIVGAKVLSTDALLTVNLDTNAPTVVSINQLNTFTNLSIRFNELMSKTAVESTFGYQIAGPTTPSVIGATLQPDGLTVILMLDAPLQLDADYSIAFTEAMDLVGNLAVSPVAFHTLKITQGFLTFETYNTAAGNAVSILTSEPSFPLHPRETFYLRSFDSREAYPDSSHESFGARFTGLFVPPTSGNWIFYMSSDDDGELWLNPTGPSAVGRTLIISAPSCCQPFSTNASSPQALTAGESYYIEALYKEGTGGDYCRVAAKLDTDPMDPNALAPISASMLGTFISPVGISLAITQNPSDQVGVASTPGKILLSQNFNADDGGFTVTNSATAPAGPWTYSAATGRWSANGGEGLTVGLASLLHSPTLTVTEAGPVVLTLNHRYNLEFSTGPLVRWDGGQVRLSVNGGSYITVQATNFTANGYKTDIVITGNNILTNQYAFNEASDGWSAGTLIQSIATLGTFNPGDQLSIQFAGAWDEYTTAGNPGWEIDSLVVSEAVFPLYAQDFTTNNGAFTVANVGTVAGPWIYNAGTGTWSANGGEGAVASLLNSPAITVSKDGFVKLTLTHRYNFEDATTFYDAGQIRVSVNGGTYNTVPAESFSTNGYAPGAIVGTGILNGQRGFTGQSAGYTNGFITSIASLGAFHAGDTVSVQFAGAWDEGYVMPPPPNWEIDKLRLDDGIAVPVTFSVMASGSVPGATTTPIAYQWQKDSGAGFVDITGATSSNLTFFVVEADNGSHYRAVVSVPGTSVVSSSALLTVGATAPSLAVVRAGGNVTIAWPATASGFVLDQTSTLLGAPIPWALVPVNTYETNGNTISVTVPAGPNNQFFQLRKQ